MTAELNVLIVDDRPDTVRFLAEFMQQRCRRCDVVGGAREATTAMTRRRVAKEPYHLVISDFVMPDIDGLAFLRELRGKNEDVPFIFMTGYRALNPAFEPEAIALGALAVLDKPVDLTRVEELLRQTTSIIAKRAARGEGDAPFFGTSRSVRRSDTGLSAMPAAPSDALEPRQAARPPTGSWQNPAFAGGAAALEPRRPEQLRSPLPGMIRTPLPSQGGTARIRRGVDGSGTGRVGRVATPQPPTTFTARVRRGVEGTGTFTRGGGEAQSRDVSCVHCGRVFATPVKPESYTTVCIHCGQLQRVDPL
jgi:CheY-like chemotaxis protein